MKAWGIPRSLWAIWLQIKVLNYDHDCVAFTAIADNCRKLWSMRLQLCLCFGFEDLKNQNVLAPNVIANLYLKSCYKLMLYSHFYFSRWIYIWFSSFFFVLHLLKTLASWCLWQGQTYACLDIDLLMRFIAYLGRVLTKSCFSSISYSHKLLLKCTFVLTKIFQAHY